MSAIARSHSSAAHAWSIFDDDGTLPVPQSEEGRCVRATVQAIADHWMARPSCVLESARDDDPFDYDPVPLKVAGKMRVKYRFKGRLEPRRYPVD